MFVCAHSCPALLRWTVAHLAPLSMGSPRQEYWSEFPSPPPGDLSNRGIEPASPALAGSSLPLCHLGKDVYVHISVQFSHSVVSGNPMDCSTPGFPVHHQFPELTQTHVHRVGDAIQPSHPLSSPSPPTFNLSQHQGLFQ